MTNHTSNETLIWCTRSDNETCWAHQVAVRNVAHAEQMTPVIVMMFLFMIVGTLGNSIVIVMYRSKKQRSSANVFVMFLAGIDLFACVVIHPYIIFKVFFFYDQTWPLVCKVFEFLLHFNLMVSSLTLLLIAVDRFLAICRPVKYLKFDRHVKKAIFAACFLALIMSIPILELYGQSPLQIKIVNGLFEGYICHYQPRYVDSSSMAIFSGLVMIGFIMQFVAMTILYKHVAVVAYRSRRAVGPMPNGHMQAGLGTTLLFKSAESSNCERLVFSMTALTTVRPSSASSVTSKTQQKKITCQSNVGHGPRLEVPSSIFCVQGPFTIGPTGSMSRPQRHNSNKHAIQTQQGNSISQLKAKRLKAAKILFLVTIVFVLSWMPFLIIRICNTLENDACHPETYFGEIVDTMLNHVFYINNAINPILYAIINKTFREEFRNLLRKRCR